MIASRPKRAQEYPQELLDKILKRQLLLRTMESCSHHLHWCRCWPRLLAEEGLDEEEHPQREPQIQRAYERAVDQIGDRHHQRGDGQREEEGEEVNQIRQASAEIWAEEWDDVHEDFKRLKEHGEPQPEGKPPSQAEPPLQHRNVLSLAAKALGLVHLTGPHAVDLWAAPRSQAQSGCSS